MMKYIKNLLLISSIFSGTQGILAMSVNDGDPESLEGHKNPNIPSGQQDTPSKTAQASSSILSSFSKYLKKINDANKNINKSYKQTIKDFILNNKDIQISENFSVNPTRITLWAGIAGLSCLNWYGNKGNSEFDLGSLLLGHMAAELLETYQDPIRNNPVITPVATYCLSLFALLPLDIQYFYKNWKFLTGWPLVAEYTAYSTFTFKAIELLKWLKEGREEREESKLALEAPEENPDSNRSEASTSSTLSLRTIDNPIANLQNDVLEFKQTLKNHPNHTQVEALIARVIAQEMAKYAQASGSKQTTLSHTLRKRNIKPTSKDPLGSDDNAQQTSFSLAPLVRVSSNEFPPDPTAIKLQPNSAQTPIISLDPEAGFIIAAGAHSAASSTDSSDTSGLLLGGNADSSLNQ